MKWIWTTVGLVFFLLGGLWFLQGTGLVTIDPIACVGECEPLRGPSAQWAVAGAILMLLGAGAIGYGWRKIKLPRG